MVDSVCDSFSSTAFIRSVPANPNLKEMGVSLRSALSCLSKVLYSALDVNIL